MDTILTSEALPSEIQMIPLRPASEDRFDYVLSSELPRQLGNATVFPSGDSSDHTISAAQNICAVVYFLAFCFLLFHMKDCSFSRSVRRLLCPCMVGVHAAPQDIPINAVAQLEAEGKTHQERKALERKRKRLEESFSGIRQVSWFGRYRERAGLCSRWKD